MTQKQEQKTQPHHYFPPPPPYHYRRRPYHSSSSLKSLCCCIFLVITILTIIALAIILTILLAFKPKPPSFQLQQAILQDINPNVSLNIRLLFKAVNPNKVGIKYDDSTFTVVYRKLPLGKASVPGFYQESQSARLIEASVVVEGADLLRRGVAEVLMKDVSLYDRVGFRVFGVLGFVFFSLILLVLRYRWTVK